MQALSANEKPNSTVTGSQLVVESLCALGVRFVFGVPGGQTLAITDALRNSLHGRRDRPSYIPA